MRFGQGIVRRATSSPAWNRRLSSLAAQVGVSGKPVIGSANAEW